MRKTFAHVSFAFALAASRSVFAMEPIPGEERFEGLLDKDEKRGGAEIGFQQIDEDFFVTITPRLDINLGKIGFGLQVPLNLRVVDRDPEQDQDYGGIIRREDWDEPSEYLRALRYFRYGHKRDFIYARVGELAAELGHGTIMSRYLNNLDLNTFRLGLQFDLNTDYGGVETMLADVGFAFDKDYVDSKLVGVRGYVKPLAIVAPDSFFNRWQIGASYVSDFNAPWQLELDAASAPVIKDDNYVIDDSKAATVMGIDSEITILQNSFVDLIPYTDFNVIQKAGWGWHLGVLTTIKLPIGLDLTLPLRLEYRRFRSDYLPTYFATFYEIERFSYPIGAAGAAPKNRAIRQGSDDEGINGYYGELAFDFAGLLQLGAIYEDYDKGDPNLAAFLSVPGLEWLQFKAYYTRTAITGTDDILKLDDRSMAIAQAQYELFTFTYLVARWTRRWTLETDAADADYGSYQPADQWKVGVEVSFAF